MTDTIDVDVKYKNVEKDYQERPEVHQETTGIKGLWQTPGIYISDAIKHRPEVKYIGEKYLKDYLQTIVVLTEDPENLLDLIFETEHKLYKKFKNLKFDIRVRVVSPDEDISALEKSTVCLFEKQT